MRKHIGLIIVVGVGIIGLATAVVGLLRTGRQPAVAPQAQVQTEQPSAGSSEPDVGQLPNLSIEGAEVIQRDEAGEIIWQVSAQGEFAYSEDNEVLQAEDIRWELMRPGQDSLIVEAPRFLASYPERKITFSEGVSAYTPDRSQLFEMSRLVYQTDTEKLLAEGGVRFRYGRYQATGHRLVIDNRAQQVRMSGGVYFARVSG